MKPRLLLALVLPLCLVTVALGDDKADTKDLETGAWKVTNVNQAGKDAPAEFIEKASLKMTFKDGAELVIDSAGETKKGTYKLDSTKTPKQFDLKMDKNPDKAIYELTNDTLKIAIGKNERPKDFTGGPDVIVFTLKRMK